MLLSSDPPVYDLGKSQLFNTEFFRLKKEKKISPTFLYLEKIGKGEYLWSPYYDGAQCKICGFAESLQQSCKVGSIILESPVVSLGGKG